MGPPNMKKNVKLLFFGELVDWKHEYDEESEKVTATVYGYEFEFTVPKDIFQTAYLVEFAKIRHDCAIVKATNGEYCTGLLNKDGYDTTRLNDILDWIPGDDEELLDKSRKLTKASNQHMLTGLELLEGMIMKIESGNFWGIVDDCEKLSVALEDSFVFNNAALILRDVKRVSVDELNLTAEKLRKETLDLRRRFGLK